IARWWREYDKLHDKARRAIESGEEKFRDAAEYLAEAQKLGASQRQEAGIGTAAPSLARTVVFSRLNEGWRHVRRRVPSKLRHRRQGPMPSVPRQKRKKLKPKLLS